jgi:hypothetical protein
MFNAKNLLKSESGYFGRYHSRWKNKHTRLEWFYPWTTCCGSGCSPRMFLPATRKFVLYMK